MKTQLDYYQQHTDIFYDRKIRRLISKYEGNGYLIFMYFKNEIFRVKGYYFEYDNQVPYDTHQIFPFISEEKILEVIKFCFENGLFHEDFFEKYKLFTSKEIQLDFFEIMSRIRRKRSPLIPEIDLIDSKKLLEDIEAESKKQEKGKTIKKSANFSPIETSEEVYINSEKNRYYSDDLNNNIVILQNNSELINSNSEHQLNASEDYRDTTEELRKSTENFKDKLIAEAQDSEFGDFKFIELPNSSIVNKGLGAENKLNEIILNQNKKNEISLSIERDTLLEIFIIEKNYSEEELNKFINHYSKIGWIDKNGNKIKDINAAARNWEQFQEKKAQIPKGIIDSMRICWIEYKKHLNLHEAKHLLNIRPKKMGNTLTFECSNEDYESCEKNIELLKIALQKGFGKDIKLEYEIID